jgi:hypothetical protein
LKKVPGQSRSRFSGAGAAFLAGADKFFNLLADWPKYLSPAAVAALPVGPDAFMQAVGVIEMVVGLAVLTAWTRLGGYVVMVWLIGIAANLVLSGYYDVAVRDVLMAIAAYTLARLTEARERAAIAISRQPSAVRSDQLIAHS